MRLRADAGLIAQMPFADEARRVAVVGEKLRKRTAGDGEACRTVDTVRTVQRPLDGDALLIPARDETGACWRAIRSVRVEVGELHALARETVDVRRLHVRSAIRAEIAITNVVREDEDDVRWPCGPLRL